jgi:hypothetical protein
MNESDIPYFDLEGRPDDERGGMLYVNPPIGNVESSLLKNEYFGHEF